MIIPMKIAPMLFPARTTTARTTTALKLVRHLSLVVLACGSWSACPWTRGADSVVVVVVDDSGSMREKMASDRGRSPRMDVAKQALSKVIQQLPDQTSLGVLLMNGARGNQGWLVPLSPLDRASTLAKIQNVRPDGGTPLGRSMKVAMDELLATRAKRPYGDYRMLVVTDGEATDNHALQAYLPDIVSRGILVDVIGVDMKSDHTLAQRTHSYRRANDAASFEKALSEVFAESTNSASGDASASDYDAIASLPNEFAKDALQALATSSNGEIHERSQYAAASQGTGSFQGPGGVARNAGQNSVGIGPSAVLGCCVGILAFVLAIAVGLSVIRSKRPR
jgi:hypothetical protein